MEAETKRKIKAKTKQKIEEKTKQKIEAERKRNIEAERKRNIESETVSPSVIPTFISTREPNDTPSRSQSCSSSELPIEYQVHHLQSIQVHHLVSSQLVF